MSAHERERLAGYLDGELSPAERAEVEAHLATCEECASLLAEMGAVDDVARGLPLEAPSGYFEALPGRVRARIEERSTPRGRRAESSVRWRMPVWAWAAAAALVLAVVTPLTLPTLYRARTPPRERPMAAAPSEDAIAPAPRSGPERLATSPADDEQLAGAPTKSQAVRGRRVQDQPAAPEPGFASAPQVAAPPAAAPAEPVPMPHARPGRMDVAAEAAPPPARSRAPELEKDTPALGGAPVPLSVESEPFEEAPPPRPDRDRRPVRMADAVTSQAAPPTLGEGEAPKGEAPAPPGVERRQEGFAAAEKKAVLDEDAVAFGRLSRDAPADARTWRERREQWRAFVAHHPDSRHIDEARVRVIEAGLEAWRGGGDPEDLARARADAEAYLARDDARLKPRVRQALESVP